MSNFFEQIEALPESDRNQVLSGLLAAQSLIRATEKDGYTIPDAIAARIATFDRTENDVFAKALFDVIFRELRLSVNDRDSEAWHWAAKQDKAVIKSLLCWLIYRATP